LGAIAERKRTLDVTAAKPAPSYARTEPAPVLADQFARVCTIVSAAYGLSADRLCTKGADPHTQLARSVAIALSRDMLAADLPSLAGHFGCADAEEAAGHCNLVAARASRACRFRITVQFLRGACVNALGLDAPPTSSVLESPL
jgi:hypothetical protein